MDHWNYGLSSTVKGLWVKFYDQWLNKYSSYVAITK